MLQEWAQGRPFHRLDADGRDGSEVRGIRFSDGSVGNPEELELRLQGEKLRLILSVQDDGVRVVWEVGSQPGGFTGCVCCLCQLRSERQVFAKEDVVVERLGQLQVLGHGRSPRDKVALTAAGSR